MLCVSWRCERLCILVLFFGSLFPFQKSYYCVQILSSGGDGLLKLWEVRTGECTATFEEQEGRVWALTSSGLQDRLIASGGADSLINIWEDSTQEMLEEHDNARAMEVGLQQEFSNAMQVSHHHAFAQLCLSLYV